MDTIEQLNLDFPKITIFCTCQEKYDSITKAFEFGIDNINKVLVKDEFLKEKDMEEIIYQSEVCYVIIALEQQKDLKIAQYIYEIAKKKDILTIGIGVKPSLLQNEEYRKICDSQISLLKNNLNSLVIIDNQIIENDESMTLEDIEKNSNDMLINTLKSIIYPISIPGIVNVEWSHFKDVMGTNEIAYVGFGSASGENRAVAAAEQAIKSNFLIEPLNKASKQLIKIECGLDMDLLEIHEATERISEASDCNAYIIFCAIVNEALKDEIKVSIVATGYSYEKMKEIDKRINSIEITNVSSGCIGPDDISKFSTKIFRSGQIEIKSYKPQPFEVYKYKISDNGIKEFFDKLLIDIKVLEWKDNYSVEVCDGYHWDVLVNFSDGTIKKVEGTVEPPPNGKLLEEMIYALLNYQVKPWVF